MNLPDLLARLRSIDDGSFVDGVDGGPRWANLPADHMAFLRTSNGCGVFGGYFRLFGLGVDHGWGEIGHWNRSDTWKDVWPARVCDYLCFGETAWGDQYAYRLDELDGEGSPPVYFLEAVTLRPEPLSNSFEEFLEQELVRNARQPYDPIVRPVRDRIGDLTAEDHVTYVPPLLLGGVEEPGNVVKLNALDAMTLQGDLAVQLADQEVARAVQGVETYRDPKGRARQRIHWAEPRVEA